MVSDVQKKKNFHRDLCGGWVRGGHKEIPLGKKCKNELVVCVCVEFNENDMMRRKKFQELIQMNKKSNLRESLYIYNVSAHLK